jgi:hypothetical protein
MENSLSSRYFGERVNPFGELKIKNYNPHK